MKLVVVTIVLAACSGARSQYVYDPQPTASCGVLREYALPTAPTPASRAAERVEKTSTRVASAECKPVEKARK